MTSLNTVGVVVIGRNEAPRLRACLESVREAPPALVYVDSGSSDGSPEIAESRGVPTIRLTSGPYTAARGRQIGLEHLCSQNPELRYVQFVDGDCVLQPGWVERATVFLEDNPQAAVVVGRLREQHANRSLLARLVDVDWDLPTGEIDAIGGIAMVRVAALRDVRGWDRDLIAGEELDLGARLRARGWKLFRLPDDMTLHDMGITSLWEMWRRSIRSGFAYAQLALLHGWNRCRRWLRRAVSNLVYGIVLPVLAIALLLVWWPGCAAIGALYVLLVLRIAYARMRRGDGVAFALLYAAVVTACKSAAGIGTLKFLSVRLSGRTGRLIEYKSAPTPAGQ